MSSWSADHRYLTFTRQASNGFADLWALPLFGNGEPFPVVVTPGNDSAEVFSPDAKWVVYTTTQGGPFNVFVQRFPEGGETTLVSRNGGGLPFWREDGRELFYLNASSPVDAVLVSVPIESVEPFKAGAPRELFRIETEDVRGDSAQGLGRLHAISEDGKRFLISIRPPANPAIEVVVNWRAAAAP